MGNDVVADEVLAVSNAVVALDPEKIAGAAGAVIQVQGAAVRFRVTGADPVAGTEGFLGLAGDMFAIDHSNDLAGFRVIREGATDAVVYVAYEE